MGGAVNMALMDLLIQHGADVNRIFVKRHHQRADKIQVVYNHRLVFHQLQLVTAHRQIPQIKRDEQRQDGSAEARVQYGERDEQVIHEDRSA